MVKIDGFEVKRRIWTIKGKKRAYSVVTQKGRRGYVAREKYRGKHNRASIRRKLQRFKEKPKIQVEPRVVEERKVLNVFKVRINGSVPIKGTNTDFYFDILFPLFRTQVKMNEVENRYKGMFESLVEEMKSKMHTDYPIKFSEPAFDIDSVGIEEDVGQESFKDRVSDKFIFVVYYYDNNSYYTHRGVKEHET